ncbi:MAG: hypothetical protein ACOVOV_13730, partial [Dolichospermum sp.]
IDYKIVWGDGSPDFTSPTFASLVSHTYPVGIYTLVYTVTRGSCVTSKNYNIFVGNVPAGGIAGNGGATICSDSTQTFTLTNFINNPPGTTYTLDTKDGAPTIYQHPPPTNITKQFKISSCGTNSSNGSTTFNNAFGAYLTINNPCGSAGGSIVPIYVSGRPKSAFTRSDTIVCQQSTVTLNSTSTKGNNVDNGTCTVGKSIWKITSPTGGTPFTLVSGSLGNDFGTSDVSVWSAGTDVLNIRFDSAGIYTINLRTGNSTLCGVHDTTMTICVNARPNANFNLSQNLICIGESVIANSSASTPLCGVTNFSWTVTYNSISGCSPTTSAFAYINGTSATSQNPEIQFDNPGLYSIGLRVRINNSNCFTDVPV